MNNVSQLKKHSGDLLIFNTAAPNDEYSRLALVFFRSKSSGWDLLETLVSANPDYAFAICDVESVQSRHTNESFGTGWEDKVLSEFTSLAAISGIALHETVLLGFDLACRESLLIGFKAKFKAVIVVGDISDPVPAYDATPGDFLAIKKELDSFHSDRLNLIVRNAGPSQVPFYHFRPIVVQGDRLGCPIWLDIGQKNPLSTVGSVGSRFSSFAVLFTHNLSLISSILSQLAHTYGPDLGTIYNGDSSISVLGKQALLSSQKKRELTRAELKSSEIRGDRFYPQGFAIIRGFPAPSYGSQSIWLSARSDTETYEFPMGNLIRKNLSDDLFYQAWVDYSAAAFATGRHEGVSLGELSEGKYELNIHVSNSGKIASCEAPSRDSVQSLGVTGKAAYLLSSGSSGSTIQKWSLLGQRIFQPQLCLDEIEAVDGLLRIRGKLGLGNFPLGPTGHRTPILMLSNERDSFSYEMESPVSFGQPDSDHSEVSVRDTFGSTNGLIDLRKLPSGKYELSIVFLNGASIINYGLKSVFLTSVSSSNRNGSIVTGTRSIAIIGSGVTCDNFDLQLCPTWESYFEMGPVHYQQSIVSLMSRPVPFDENCFDALTEGDKDLAIRGFTKRFLEEVSLDVPEVLIVDLFADANFATISIDEGFITDNEWRPTQGIDLYESMSVSERFSMKIDSKQYTELFREALHRLKLFLDAAAPETAVVLNRARAVNHYLRDGKQISLAAEGNKVLNGHWSELEAIFIEVFDPILIESMTPGTLSDEGHPRGPANVHYESRFYASFIQKLTACLGFDSRLIVNVRDGN